MSKFDYLSDLLEFLLKNPIGFLVSFIVFLLVPSKYVLSLFIAGQYAENSGHVILGGFLTLIYGIVDKFSIFIFETFIFLIVYAVVAVVIISAFLGALGFKK
ncbi:hypothetical protein [Methanococcoides sp. NM1]|uniref:hypothetical protein n=1 Tax=Methanococcoides sp. NM1 TaxID=1201013 RepID=UPI00108490BA|nr:hypothetical protein [Methanococcoides sp. NM1]